MKQEITNIYKFEELSEEAKEKVVENLSTINEWNEWWGFTYKDAARIGMKITAFDIDNRSSYLNADYTECFEDVARLVLENHGEPCDTYQLAKQFLADWENLSEDEKNAYNGDKGDKLEKDFDHSLREEYLNILRQAYDHLTSEEAIIETILANDYEFTGNGELY